MTERLIDAVALTAPRDALLAPWVTRRLISESAQRQINTPQQLPALEELTPREIEILQLLGRSRAAAVLTALDAPRPTAELAQRLGLSPPSVSQHLGVLRAAGLVHASRVGRLVLYARTQRGDALLGAQDV